MASIVLGTIYANHYIDINIKNSHVSRIDKTMKVVVAVKDQLITSKTAFKLLYM